ncbi:hypothetical protein COCMIDRAFT_23286 [Bipolaris oryzae ATCC 44560]|uniref:Uncharacterized protein n=1 Tax=Bipolaris oryzae ATCC 44560 TaxID=930090 RepID=W6ZG93_COCMI|nr:uncharacterized protein COCMIDRAFT_23286 [Bipolaris oryzae ATCC 44560]EUC48908.1 hypothetical protein COCMIDRAFT_23286 [Bipolaris oryzae ATCC 44560]
MAVVATWNGFGMPLGGFGSEAAISGPGRSESRVLDPSIHPSTGERDHGREAKSRAGRKKKGGLQAQGRGWVVCECKGPGDGHVMDAREKKKGAVGWTGTPWLARQGKPWRGWRRRGGGEAGRAVKGYRHVQRWHESQLANRWEIQGCLDRKASRRPREEKPCHGGVMVVDGWMGGWWPGQLAYLVGERCTSTHRYSSSRCTCSCSYPYPYPGGCCDDTLPLHHAPKVGAPSIQMAAAAAAGVYTQAGSWWFGSCEQCWAHAGLSRGKQFCQQAASRASRGQDGRQES